MLARPDAPDLTASLPGLLGRDVTQNDPVVFRSRPDVPALGAAMVIDVRDFANRSDVRRVRQRDFARGAMRGKCPPFLVHAGGPAEPARVLYAERTAPSKPGGSIERRGCPCPAARLRVLHSGGRKWSPAGQSENLVAPAPRQNCG